MYAGAMKLSKSEAKLVLHMIKFYIQLSVSYDKKQKAVNLYKKLEDALEPA